MVVRVEKNQINHIKKQVQAKIVATGAGAIGQTVLWEQARVGFKPCLYNEALHALLA